MSLYRTYRPQSFPDVAGQEHVVTTLEQAVKQNKLAHAYLFSGVRGTGKTSIARILAKIILTHGMTDEKIKGQIEQGVEEGNLVDLTEIDAASNRGIDDIRALIEKIQFTPVVAAAKVYIIDEVHMLTREAFNALLKTLEEPPPYAFFILATTELHKIPATIQSRCQRFLFKALKEDDIIRRLQFIADQEKIEVERAALRAIARSVGGSLRDAISLLDQLRSLPSITAEEVSTRIGETGHEEAATMMTAIAANDVATVIATLHRLEEAAVPLENVARLLLTDVREALHQAIEEKADITKLLRALDALLEAIRDMRASPVPALVLETALLTLAAGGSSVIAKKEPDENLAAPIVRAAVQAAAPTPVAAPISAATQEEEALPLAKTLQAPELSMQNIQKLWPEVLRMTEPASVRMSLKNGRLEKIEGNAITVSFSSAFHRDKVAGIDSVRGVESALEQVFKQSVRLKCTLETEKSPGATSELVNLAEAAAEIF